MTMFQDMLSDPTESLLTSPKDDSGVFAVSAPDYTSLEETRDCKPLCKGAAAYLDFLGLEV